MADASQAADTAPLSPKLAATLLGASLAIVRAEVGALSPELLRWRPAAEQWCALEIIGHFIETEERGFAGRIRTILASDRPTFSGWDPDGVARARQDADADSGELLAEFARRRTASVALVETLTDADMVRGGDHPEVGLLTVRDVLQEWVHHDCSHLRQLLAIIQAYSWPHMGNAQRFSAPESEVKPAVS